MDGAQLATLCDTQIIAAAWDRWGDNALDYIIGDFALIIWDVQQRTLTLARDPFGQKPLFYCHQSSLAAAASMPAGLHALAEVPRRADQERVAEFLALIPEAGPRSFFAGVSRVEPGQIVTLRRAGVSARRYWPGPITPIRYLRSKDYAEALRERFDAAVGARLRGVDGIVAAHLSGGLDSSAVTGTAARLLGANGAVLALTSVPRAGFAGPVSPRQFGDEWELAAATAALYPNVRHIAVRTDGNPVEELGCAFDFYERPFPNLPNIRWWHATNAAARDAGATVLLTGATGNMTISYNGLDVLPEWFARGRWMKLAQTTLALRRHGYSAKSMAARAIGPFLPNRVWKLARTSATSEATFRQVTALNPNPGLENDAFRNGAGTFDARPPRDTWAARFRGLGWVDPGPFNKGALAGWGLDVRDPTADRRVVEFCLAIPPEQFLVDAVPRSLARRAFADRLPLAVVDERRIGYQAADWIEALADARAQLRTELDRISDCEEAATLIDIARLITMVDDRPQGEWGQADTVTAYRSTLMRAISAGNFLRRIRSGSM